MTGDLVLTENLKILQTKNLYLDNDFDTRISGESNDDRIYFRCGGVVMLRMTKTSSTFYKSFWAYDDDVLDLGKVGVRWGAVWLAPQTDANRGNPTEGRIIFNIDDLSLNLGDGTNWRDMDGNIT